VSPQTNWIQITHKIHRLNGPMMDHSEGHGRQHHLWHGRWWWQMACSPYHDWADTF